VSESAPVVYRRHCTPLVITTKFVGLINDGPGTTGLENVMIVPLGYVHVIPSALRVPLARAEGRQPVADATAVFQQFGPLIHAQLKIPASSESPSLADGPPCAESSTLAASPASGDVAGLAHAARSVARAMQDLMGASLRAGAPCVVANAASVPAPPSPAAGA
jgi:hypothetical protein